MFSVQIDTTQDISGKDQCSVILRYVTNVVHERLVAVVSCEASSGRYFSQLVKEVIDTLQLDMSNFIGYSTDGAANTAQWLFCLSFLHTLQTKCMCGVMHIS